MPTRKVPTWKATGDDAVILVQAFNNKQSPLNGGDIKEFRDWLQRNQEFARKYGLEDENEEVQKKNFRNLRLNQLNLWKKYQKWEKDGTGKCNGN